ncbi:hypothetical protein CMQ_4111 [Grosmannia clavigera kw1407]|uniref:Uncharacterized protein n=1 Tax=Grosmannia clavigera (strain kw1407 / UAMH 11150) TaxID=655863 RepID=F0X940_GROCL|nr:uncharacterized protein CMQ_4111 [Grosmannia clavigera kw1407]EFX06042.1 hypothetical protein CMQ_4111 [Grosmannia clavigera kw1407]
MAHPQNDHRPASPPPEAVPTAALPHGLGPAKLSRCVSTASSLSHGSTTTRDSRESLGSDASSTANSLSRQSSGCYPLSLQTGAAAPGSLSLPSLQSYPTTPSLPNQHLVRRRGYMRPQGTDFAASARSRESVLSLGSITHLQHYFARTGLLDLKGQLERRRRGIGKARTLDLSQLDPASYLTLQPAKTTRPVSMMAAPPGLFLGDQPDQDDYNSFAPDDPDNLLVESPVQDDGLPVDDAPDDDWDPDDDEDGMLPPTVSTYRFRETTLPKPPTQAELRADLKAALTDGSKALAEIRAGMAARARAKAAKAELAALAAEPPSPQREETATPMSNDYFTSVRNHADSVTSVRSVATTAWYEIQGMHILDIMTLAIRAAKVFYTSHEHPDLLDAIKPEREVRSELLGVMDVLRRMATRNFAGGARRDELRAMEAWIASLHAMLDAEDAMFAAEKAERAGWTWLRDGDWPAGPGIDGKDRLRAYAREHAFMQSILVGYSTEVIPDWIPIDRSDVGADTPRDDTTDDGPVASTPFLQHLQSGVCLVRLHNCAVRRSRRRFGAIPTFHADTQKPYRAADNLRYWVKAAELRWEILLKIDALAVVCNNSTAALAAFEDAIYQWCRKVREEVAASADDDEL